MFDKRYSFPLAIKFSGASEAGTFSGYGSTFGGSPDSYGDVIAPGAFSKSIAAHRAAETSPALLWSHDVNQPIGVITQLAEDARGLRVDGKLTLGVARAAEAHALMKDGALAFSIGYLPIASTPLGKRGRQLDEVRLFEISAVALPANTNAKLISVKVRPDLVDQHNPRVIEQILRDGGVTRNQAKRILSLGRSAFKQRDAAIAEDILARKMLAASRAIQNSF